MTAGPSEFTTGAPTPRTTPVKTQSAAQSPYDHGDPTPQEQLLLELINRARANPLEEVSRLKLDLNQGLPAGTITSTPKQPLTFHRLLINAARAHTQWMLNTDTFEHIGIDGSTPGDRMSSAGYPFSGGWAWGENLGWKGTSGAVPLTAFTGDVHDGLIISPGHRVNILSDKFDEIGLGILSGPFSAQGNTFNSVLITEKFARSGGTPGPVLFGVVYRDANGDGLYSVGEGVAGIQIAPSKGPFYAVSSTSGGFAIPMPGVTGSVQLTVTGASILGSVSKTVSLTGANLKTDFDLSREVLSATAPIKLSRPFYRPDGLFEFRVEGNDGDRVEIQSSSDLSGWTRVGAVTIQNAFVVFVDSTAGVLSQRFYRGRRSP